MNVARWLLALGVCLTALGAKLSLVRTYGNDVPFWDQWDAEGGALFIPHAEHRLTPAAFFAPHNEHRIVATRLTNYAVAVANRQWDPQLEMTVNALLHAAFAGLLVLLASRIVRGFALAAIAALILAAFVLPLAWENTLAGFQSPFYFLAWTSVAFLWLTVPAAPLGLRWWVGLLVGVIGLGTMSSGFFCFGAAFALSVGRAFLWERRRTPRDFAAMGLHLALCGVGLALMTHVPGHDAIRAGSPVGWFLSLLKVLAWPANRWIATAFVLQLPLAGYALARLRDRTLADDDALVLAFALWWWMQAAAIAYGRANFGINNSPRYYDLYAIGVILNALALIRLWPAPRRTWAALAVGWCALVVVGTTLQMKTARDFLDSFLVNNPAIRAHVARFVRDGDLAAFAAEPDKVPLPSAPQLAAYLSHPGLRPLLPASVRPPLSLTASTADGFARAPADARLAHPPGEVWRAPRGPARFVSEPLSAATLPVLRFTFAGDAPLDASVVRLESAEGQRAGLAIDRVAGDRWQTAHLRFPAGAQVRLIVDLPAGAPGFAFADPVELGTGSFYAHHVLKNAALPFSAGVILLVGGGLFLARAALAPPAPKKG